MQYRRGLAPNVILIVCALGIVMLAIIYLGTSMGDDRVAAPNPTRLTPPTTVAPTPTRTPAPTPIPPPASVNEDDLGPAQVELTPVDFDFGVMEPGSVNQKTIQLRNTANTPLRVLGSKKTCSCTQVSLTPGYLQPGESMPVTAIMTAGLAPADKSTVKVVVQYQGFAPTTIPIQGIISLPVQLMPRQIRMHPKGYDAEYYQTRGTVTVRSLDGTPIRVLSAGGELPELLSGNKEESIAAPQHAIRWDVSEFDRETGMNEDGELIPEFWLIETDHPTTPVVELPLNHKIYRVFRGDCPWFTIDRRVVVKNVESGESAEFLLPVSGNNTPSTADPIYQVESESPEFTAELLGGEQALDGKTLNLRIKITPADDVRGAYMGRINLISSQYSAPFAVIGSVSEPSSP